MHFSAPANAALLVIDVQCGWYRSTPGPHDAAGTLRRINELIRKARAAARPVIFIQHGEPPDYPVGSPAWRLLPELDRMPSDLVVGKSVCDAFCGTVLEEELRRRGIETLVLAGCATEFCVDTTLRAALSRGFQVVAAMNAHTTKDRPVLTAVQIIAHHHWVWSEMSAPHPVRLVRTDDLTFS
jgi:nicotinamidase-related amidase